MLAGRLTTQHTCSYRTTKKTKVRSQVHMRPAIKEKMLGPIQRSNKEWKGSLGLVKKEAVAEHRLAQR